MFTFPKSIADPSAAPVATFTSNKTNVKTAAPAGDAGGFASALKSLAAKQTGAAGTAAAPAAAATTGSSSAAGSTAAGGSAKDSSEDKFLTLLVAQMRHQDPLNPLDNAQVTSQLAQINTVTGIDKLNTSMQSLIQNLGAQDALQGASLIGRQVLVEGNGLNIGDSAETSSLSGAIELPTAAANVALQVSDATGNPVAQMTLGALDAGVHSFQWDGKDGDGKALDAGKYTFQVVASNAKDPVSAVTLAPARVTGVTRSDSGYDLQLESGAVVGRDSVRGVR